MLEFAPNTYSLEYQDGAYLCNEDKRVEAPLNLETLAEAARNFNRWASTMRLLEMNAFPSWRKFLN